VETLRWLEKDSVLLVLDQTKLPGEISYLTCADYREVAQAIKRLAVRGAPAIGAAAAFALVLAAKACRHYPYKEAVSYIEGAAKELAATRPTAVNLMWALDRMLKKMRSLPAGGSGEELAAALLGEAQAIFREDIEANQKIGLYGQELLPDRARVLTHCNAGALATAGYGTALGVLRAAREQGKELSVYACETRPLLQGARLTAWELMREGVPLTLITDGMAGYLMAKKMVDLVMVGADRIAANGDTANKIGTYALAVLARHHGLPFYVAAPASTVDLSLPSGEGIPVEERDPSEVTHLAGVQLAPPGVKVWNPAFDVTPHELIAAIITERGIIRPPFKEKLAAVIRGG